MNIELKPQPPMRSVFPEYWAGRWVVILSAISEGQSLRVNMTPEEAIVLGHELIKEGRKWCPETPPTNPVPRPRKAAGKKQRRELTQQNQPIPTTSEGRGKRTQKGRNRKGRE